jgi:hypothetical protein
MENGNVENSENIKIEDNKYEILFEKMLKIIDERNEKTEKIFKNLKLENIELKKSVRYKCEYCQKTVKRNLEKTVKNTVCLCNICYKNYKIFCKK